MGIFDSDFDIENNIRQRIPELDNLENRELFKAIAGNSTLELYKHIKSEYDALEKRVFDETPRAMRLPDLITCVVPLEKYDVTDANLFPIFAEDLNRTEIDAQEMIYNVQNGREFFLYTCMIKADFLELKKLMQTSRRFKGVIENEYGETSAEFILKPNEQYLNFVEAKVTNKPLIFETYSTEEFIDYEYRTGDRAQFLEISFRPRNEDFYLNRDLMSFLVTAIQHLFPEYQCIGKLV